MPALIKCNGYYDVEANIFIGTRDNRVVVLRSNKQPMSLETALTLKSNIVDMLVNDTHLIVATSDRLIKCYTMQVFICLN